MKLSLLFSILFMSYGSYSRFVSDALLGGGGGGGGGGGEITTVRETMEHSEVCISCLFFGVFSKVNFLSV